MFILKLTDGTDEVDFMGGFYALGDGGLQVALPEAKEVWGGNSMYANGAQLIMSSYDNREATLTFEVLGETRDSLIANVARIDRLIETAKIFSIEESGKRVEFQYAWDGNSQTTYFEVVSGKLEWPENVMSVEQVHQQTHAGLYVITDFVLTLNLHPFAYSISPVNGVAIPVALSNSLEAGAQVTVYNSNDTGRVNYVEVQGTDLPGSFPLPVNLTLQRTLGEGENIGKVYIGVRKGNMGFKTKLDDNAAVYRIGGATSTPDADNSVNGTYTVLPFMGKAPLVLARWTLTSTEANATQGPFRIFGKVKDTTIWDPNANYCLAITNAGGSVLLDQTEWHTPLNSTTTLLDFGTVFLPPWLGSMTDIAGLSIELRAMHKSDDVAASVSLDYLALLPQDGGYRVLAYRGAGMSLLETLVDDGWNKVVYHQDTNGKKMALAYGMMPALMLRPGVTQRLYFLMEGINGNSEIKRQLRVSLGVVPAYMVLA